MSFKDIPKLANQVANLWPSPTVLGDWNSSPPLPKSLTCSRLKSKTGKIPSLSSVLGLSNPKASGYFCGHLGRCVLYTRRVEVMNASAT